MTGTNSTVVYYFIPWVLVQSLAGSDLSFSFLSFGYLVNDLGDRRLLKSEPIKADMTAEVTTPCPDTDRNKKDPSNWFSAYMILDRENVKLHKGGREIISLRSTFIKIN